MSPDRKYIRHSLLNLSILAILVSAGSHAGLTALAEDVNDIIYGPNPSRAVDEAKVTYFVSPSGNDTNDGTSRVKAFRTMQKAADQVKPGERVLVLKGIYPHGFKINKTGQPDAWVEMIAEPGTEIRGSDVVKTWVLETGFRDPVYSIPLPSLDGRSQKADVPLYNRIEQVFSTGKLLNYVPDTNMLKPKGVFCPDYNQKKLYVCLKDGKNPNDIDTEVSYRTWGIIIGSENEADTQGAYIRIDGFTLRNIANHETTAAIQIRWKSSHIIIENCDVQWVSGFGISSSGGRAFLKATREWIMLPVTDSVIRNNIMSHCGIGGVGGLCSHNLVIEKNILDDNNYKGLSAWSRGGGIKTGFNGYGIVIRHNIARNSNNHGLWLDYGSTNCVFENNFVDLSMEGGILNEATPGPRMVFNPDGQVGMEEPTLDQLKAMRSNGTTIRNNVIVRTARYGGGINSSCSPRSSIYNNIIAYCDGCAINLHGSDKRASTLGCFGGRVYANISYQNFCGIDLATPAGWPSGRCFDNVVRDNLFIGWKGEKPVKLDGTFADAAAFEAFTGQQNIFMPSASLFRDPEHYDFTITNPELAKKIGFDSRALRLDWSKYYRLPPRSEDPASTVNQRCTPLSLLTVVNRALTDTKAGDGEGGWTDQGSNDLGSFPRGRQTFCGIDYDIPVSNNAAVAFANRVFKGGDTLPRSVDIPVAKAFDRLFFLYTAAWLGPNSDDKAVVTFTIHYTDGTHHAVPVMGRLNVMDWFSDPTANWQECATLNENKTYIAWQGPNSDRNKVTVYYLEWANPEPGKTIQSITAAKNETIGACFFLLGITGANTLTGTSHPAGEVFTMNFDGDGKAVNAVGNDVEPLGLNPQVFDGGKFEPGIKDQGFNPRKPLQFPLTKSFPKEQGTVSLWLKPGDYLSDERIKVIRSFDYVSVMNPMTILYRDDATGRETGWRLSFRIDVMAKTLTLESTLGGAVVRRDVTSLFKPGTWQNLCITWGRAGDPSKTDARCYVNGTLLADVQAPALDYLKASRPSGLYVGGSDRGIQFWIGVMDELRIWDRPLTPKDIQELILTH